MSLCCFPSLRVLEVGRKDEHHFQLPAAGDFETLAVEEDQLLGGPLAFRIFDLHA